MAKQKSNFVYPISPVDGAWEQELGITKREYFASMAMQGLMTQCIAGSHNLNEPNQNKERARFAVDMADELIKTLQTHS